MNHFRDLDFVQFLTPNKAEDRDSLCVLLNRRLSGSFLLDKFVQYVLKPLTGLGSTEMQETPGMQILEGLVAK